MHEIIKATISALLTGQISSVLEKRINDDPQFVRFFLMNGIRLFQPLHILPDGKLLYQALLDESQLALRAARREGLARRSMRASRSEELFMKLLVRFYHTEVFIFDGDLPEEDAKLVLLALIKVASAVIVQYRLGFVMPPNDQPLRPHDGNEPSQFPRSSICAYKENEQKEVLGPSV